MNSSPVTAAHLQSPSLSVAVHPNPNPGGSFGVRRAVTPASSLTGPCFCTHHLSRASDLCLKRGVIISPLMGPYMRVSWVDCKAPGRTESLRARCPRPRPLLLSMQRRSNGRTCSSREVRVLPTPPSPTCELAATEDRPRAMGTQPHVRESRSIAF